MTKTSKTQPQTKLHSKINLCNRTSNISKLRPGIRTKFSYSILYQGWMNINTFGSEASEPIKFFYWYGDVTLSVPDGCLRWSSEVWLIQAASLSNIHPATVRSSEINLQWSLTTLHYSPVLPVFAEVAYFSRVTFSEPPIFHWHRWNLAQKSIFTNIGKWPQFTFSNACWQKDGMYKQQLPTDPSPLHNPSSSNKDQRMVQKQKFIEPNGLTSYTRQAFSVATPFTLMPSLHNILCVYRPCYTALQHFLYLCIHRFTL